MRLRHGCAMKPLERDRRPRDPEKAATRRRCAPSPSPTGPAGFRRGELRREAQGSRASTESPSSRSSRSSKPATSSTTTAMARTSWPTAPAAGRGRPASAQELKRSGLGAEVIQTTMDKAKDDGPDFAACARAARARKFGPETPQRLERTPRQARFLQYRGFSSDHIRAVLEGVPDD